jgi:ribosomal protein S18 acetylase RimI-like enzyme
VLDVEVRAEFRRLGYGAAVMRAAEHEARRHGASWLGLSVFGVNDQARRLFERLGYRPIYAKHVSVLLARS